MAVGHKSMGLFCVDMKVYMPDPRTPHHQHNPSSTSPNGLFAIQDKNKEAVARCKEWKHLMKDAIAA